MVGTKLQAYPGFGESNNSSRETNTLLYVVVRANYKFDEVEFVEGR